MIQLTMLYEIRIAPGDYVGEGHMPTNRTRGTVISRARSQIEAIAAEST
jgi:hypothetical protein